MSIILKIPLFLSLNIVLSSMPPALETAFRDADMHGKYRMIDSLIAGGFFEAEFFDSLLNSEHFRLSFPTWDVYRVLQSRTAMKLAGIPDQTAIPVLERYYYGAERKRSLIRPETYNIRFGWQRIVASAKDADGVTWALTTLWWFGCHQDLWLIKEGPDDTTWYGPWFTGKALGAVREGHHNYRNESCSLSYSNGNLHFLLPDRGLDEIISPAILSQDTDTDGLYDLEEERFTTDAMNPDTDKDGLSDGEDMNPLATPKDTLSDKEKIRLAAFRSFASNNYAYNIYIIKESVGNGLEYYSRSPNALILRLDSLAYSNFTSQCTIQGGYAILWMDIAMTSINPDSTYLSVDFRKMVHGCTAIRRNGVWMITECKPISHWD